MTDRTEKTALIRSQNDEFRRRVGDYRLLNVRVEGRYIMTQGIRALGDEALLEICRKVGTFDAFTPGNNPHGEHDFGAFDHNGQKVFWKIDYYDRTFEYGSEDPSDLAQTRRVLTIMLAEEY